MLFLASSSLIAPAVGMVFWALVIFLFTWLILGRFTFKPIARALREREDSINDALAQADQAREEMAKIQSDNAAALKAQQAERAAMLKEAKETKERIINEAKAEAKEVTAKMIADAQQEIANQKEAAMASVKNDAGKMAIQIAEKVLRKQLGNQPEQLSYAESLVNEIKLN